MKLKEIYTNYNFIFALYIIKSETKKFNANSNNNLEKIP